MKNKIIFIVIILLVFMILLVPLKGSYAFYSDNKDLEVINTRVGNWKSTIDYLRMNDKNNNLSEDTPGGMYRYQGTDDVDNWICFGTTANCGTNNDDIDKYMYRIIGITKEGELKLLKETIIKEDNAFLSVQWNNISDLSQPYIGEDGTKCDGTNCDWPNTTLFKRLNGLNNGETVKGSTGNSEIFVDSEYYDYLKSGDGSGSNNTAESKWYQIIENHSWLYGDIYDSVWNDSIVHNAASYDGNAIYEFESGNKSTQRIWPKIGQSCSGTTPCEIEDYTWTETTNAKIGLMYIHDYYYAYYDGINEETRGKPANSQTAVKAWAHFYKDGYNPTSLRYEWVMTRAGIDRTTLSYIMTFLISYSGYITRDNITSFCYVTDQSKYMSVRPVFYLNSDVKIKYGTGTKTDPFIINI